MALSNSTICRRCCWTQAYWQRVSLLTLFACMFLESMANAQETNIDSAKAQAESASDNPFQSDEVDASIDRGIRFLLTQQRPDGAIVDRAHETTMSALAVMALASTGVTPSSNDDRGVACRRALEYVLKDDRQDKAGYFGAADGSRMYGHGIITLMLTEMLGMGADEAQDDLIHKKCQKAIDLILSAQKHRKNSKSHQGGWRYAPNAEDSDLSVSVWQLMALRSAKNDGLAVPAEAIQDAVGYLERSFTERNKKLKSGGFSYLPEQNNPTFAMTAAGLLAMQVCGQYDSPMAESASEWLLKHPPKPNERFIYYGTYYFSQGMYQRGGDHAAQANRLVRSLLLPTQLGNGSWEANGGEEQSAGKTYATCMSILSLSVKHHYLPIYQR
jgi:hypothetical protein